MLLDQRYILCSEQFPETYRFSDITKQSLRQGPVAVTAVNGACYPRIFSCGVFQQQTACTVNANVNVNETICASRVIFGKISLYNV